MPRQDSKRGLAVTTSPFEQPFETAITRFGVKGLNITDALDTVEPDELSRMLNVTHRLDGGVTSRPGLQAVISDGSSSSKVHSIRRLNDPTDGSYRRIFGVNTTLFQGTTGTMSQIDSGYSGDPLTMVPYRPPFSSEAWMFVADRTKMVKVRSNDGLVIPIGLTPPSNVATATLGVQQTTVIADFTTPATNYLAWTPNAGYTYDDPPTQTGVPQTFGITTTDGSNGVNFQTNVNGTVQPKGYYSFWGMPISLNLSQVGTQPAQDDDYLHLWLNFSHTDFIQEARVYFVCSANFSPSILPGTLDGTDTNVDAYVHSFTPSDFALFVQAQLTQNDASEIARIRSIRDTSLKNSAPTVGEARLNQIDAVGGLFGGSPLDTQLAAQDQSKTIGTQGSPASNAWQEMGILGVPFRRGDWQRIGTTTGRDWSTITGMIVYVQAGPNAAEVAVRIGNMYLTGGSGPDSGDPASSPYDYRFTHYDTRTGAESNPSPIMDAANYIDAIRREIDVSPSAYGNGSIRQNFYRRGGTLPTDWFFLGRNTADGGAYADILDDTEIEASNTVEIDNDQPISTVNDAGVTILDQPLPALWGPLDDLLFGCGDPYRPGHVYFCKSGKPDAWPPNNITEVCSPSEELMMGCLYGGQTFVFSRERLFVLYPNFSGLGTTVTSTVTQCKKGMVNRWGLAVGIGGIYFIAEDGIYRTVGGPEEWLSRKIDPLFRGQFKNGVSPIDFTHPEMLRLEIHENELFFHYQDLAGDRNVMVYNVPYGFWRKYRFNRQTAVTYSDEGNQSSVLLLGSANFGTCWQHIGFGDDGETIDCSFRTGCINFGRPREEKLLGDQAVDADTQGVEITLQNLLNNETVTNPTQTLDALTGRKRAIFDGFGTTPQRCENIATDISWSSLSAAPVAYFVGTSIILEPDITNNRVTQWEDLGHPDESYLTGVTFDCDTGGANRTIIVEYDLGGTINIAATLTVNTAGRRKVKFSWPSVQANKVRIRPNDGCQAWILWKVDWIALPEPPRIAGWDTHFENGWDNYYTGVDLYCDTFGLDKTVQIYVDQTLIGTYTVNTNGRKVFHITLPWGRGHVFHLVATDTNPGLLYEYRWQIQPEPSEQTNWNQNFTVAGSEADKFLKAIVFQCDTFGQNKTVTVECDGVVVETLTVNTNGRKVVQLAFPQQLGRVFRIYPTDSNPGRLYTLWWVFDQEPLALSRWETQEIDHSIPGWHYPIYGHITIKSVTDVTLQITAYNQSGAATSNSYTIPSTGGVKRKSFVPFNASKGILYKYIFTSADPFWLYREETAVAVRVWGIDRTISAKPFGNDDLDSTRVMTRAESAAARQGGGSA